MKDRIFMLFIYAVVGSILIGSILFLKSCNSYINDYNNDDKKQEFNSGNSFICNDDVFNNKKYLVKKNDGWSIYKESFKKDDILLVIGRCSKEK